jgi:putative SOS response-associated peptidase YedK
MAKQPGTAEWVRTFATITKDSNELVADIQIACPLTLAPSDYLRWLSEEPDPRELMRPFAADDADVARSRDGSISRRTIILQSLSRELASYAGIGSAD